MNAVLLGILLAFGQVGISLGAVGFLGVSTGTIVSVGVFGFILGGLTVTWYLTRPISFDPRNLEKYLKSKGFRRIAVK